MRTLRLLTLVPVLCSVSVAAATPNVEIRCAKARNELQRVTASLKQVDPNYAGDLQRERRLWEKQVLRICRQRGKRS